MLNIGVLAQADAAKNSGANVGTYSVALNTGSSPIQVGGYFGLHPMLGSSLSTLGGGSLTLPSAALIANNGTTTSPIFLGLDNGTTVFSIGDGGVITASATSTFAGLVGIGTTFPSSTLHVIGTSTLAGNILLGTGTTGVVPSIRNLDNFANMAQLSFYPNSGTNVNQSFSVIPRGTGTSGNRAQFSLFNTDYIADSANYEFATFRATGSLFTLATGKVGTGNNLPLMLAAGYASDGTTNANQLYLGTTGSVGIGTASPSSTLHVVGSFQVTATSTFSANSTFGANVIISSGNLGIGTTQPSSTLHVVGTSQFSATSTFEGYTAIGNLAAGELSFDSDSGQVTWMDMLVTASSSAATVQSYSAQLDGKKALTVYGEADGLGDIGSPRVGIGTAFPSSTLHVVGTAQFSATSSFGGNLGIGTSTVTSRLDIKSDGVIPITQWFNSAGTLVQKVGAAGGFIVGRVASDTDTLAWQRVILSGAGETGLAIRGATAQNNDYFQINSANASANAGDIFSVKSTGFVGIGTAQPSSTLHVVGDFRAGTSTIFGDFRAASSTFTDTVAIQKVGAAGLYLYATGTTAYTSLTGNGTQSQIRFDTPSAAQSVSIGLNPPGASGFAGAGDLIFGNTGSGWQERMRLTFANGFLGIGTSQPSSTLHVVGTAQFSATSTFNGRVGIGTNQPSSTLHVVGDLTVTATSTFSGYTSISNAALGALSFDSDAGMVSWMDMAVTSSSASGTVMSYTAQIDGNPLLTLYGESNGTGGVQNLRIGIATSTPAYGFVLGDGTTQKDMYIPKGALCVDVNANGCPANPTAGTIYASSTSLTGIDVAENYSVLDLSIEPGDVVAIDRANDESIVKASSTHDILGVISTAPGALLGRTTTSTRAVALSGRVPVKVSIENGPIRIGDELTASPTKPGLAMRATESGLHIGTALSAFPNASTTPGATEGKVIVFVKTGFALAPLDDERMMAAIDAATALPEPATTLDGFTAAIQNSFKKMGILVDKGIARFREIFADKVTTQQLCVGSTCVDENQLKNLLQQNGQQPAPQQNPPQNQPAENPPAENPTSTDNGDITPPTDNPPSDNPPAEEPPAETPPPDPAPAG